MVRGIVRQPDGELILVDKRHDALHELRTPTVILRTIVEIDHQRRDGGEPSAHTFPPVDQPIDQAVTGHFGGNPIDKQFIQGGQENAHRGHRRLRLKIVVGGLHQDPTRAPAGEGPNFDGGFRIHRNP